MEALAKYIACALKKEHQCAVYDIELDRVWPRNGVRRQKKIEEFAKKHGWQVGHYKEGFAAIFVKEPPFRRNRIAIGGYGLLVLPVEIESSVRPEHREHVLRYKATSRN
jgi:hypothetical protein